MINISLLFLFHIFFFIRAFLLSKSIGKTIKAKDNVLNIAIFTAGLTTVIYLLQILLPQLEKYLLIIQCEQRLDIIGTIFIASGLLFSSISSLNLGKSWRIGVDSSEKTNLISNGIYKISRNPYFLSYDVVLIGISFVSLSLFVIAFSITTMILFHILILKEEVYLDKIHTDSYREYKRKVRRYL
jgi:protein-S-isoprenylcysteine O-methyltransferase Ste14